MRADDAVGTLCQSDLPRLWLPKREDLIPLAEIPTLGTGKVDLRGLKRLALERAGGLLHTEAREGRKARRSLGAGLTPACGNPRSRSRRAGGLQRRAYGVFLGNIASRFAACQAKTAATVAICFTSSACTRSKKSMFV